MGVVGRAEAGLGDAEGVVACLVCGSSAVAIGIRPRWVPVGVITFAPSPRLGHMQAGQPTLGTGADPWPLARNASPMSGVYRTSGELRPVRISLTQKRTVLEGLPGGGGASSA
jgi:hypothetical protein